MLTPLPIEQRAQGKLFIYIPMGKLLYTKPALTYSEQINQLIERGLTFENPKKVKHLLEVVSYYRLSGYWFPMLKDKQKHIFKENSNFETAFNIYKFDRELRALIIRELEKIEVAVRTKMIYILSHSKGAFWRKDISNFSNSSKHQETLKKIDVEYSRSDEEFIKSFKNKYSNNLPPNWMIFETSSFGVLSSLYNNLKPSRDKRDIANFFGLSERVFSSWLHSIVYLRNICAHHSRLWNKEMRIQPMIPSNTKYSFLKTHNLNTSNIANNKSYFILSMTIYLMNIVNPKHTIQNKFKSLLTKYPNIDTRAMGFPINWENESLWK